MKLLVLIIAFYSSLFAIKLTDYIDKSKCDQVIDKQIYEVCYSYKYKGALAGWAVLYGDKVNDVNIKKRPRFYNEKAIPMKYRTKYKDYTGYGKKWNRGHFIVADADIDYDEKILRKGYSMCQIQPQAAKVNQMTWLKVEKYGRSVAVKLGSVYSISIADYKAATKKIGNGIIIPKGFYRIYYNNEAGFEKCFYYENSLKVDAASDKLKDHVVDCLEVYGLLNSTSPISDSL